MKHSAASDRDYREASGDVEERRPPTPNELHRAELLGHTLCLGCGQELHGLINPAFAQLCADCENEDADAEAGQ